MKPQPPANPRGGRTFTRRLGIRLHRLKRNRAVRALGTTIAAVAILATPPILWLTWPILPEVPPELNIKPDAEGFDSTTLPENQSLKTFGSVGLNKIFKAPEWRRIPVPRAENVDLTFFFLLSDQTQQNWKLPKGQKKDEALRDFFRTAEGGHITPGAEIASITDKTGKELDLKPVQKSRLLTIVLFQKKQGLWLKDPRMAVSSYFVPLNTTNLRVYTCETQDGQKVLDDKSYHRLGKEFAHIKDPEFYKKLFLTILYGFRDEWIPQDPDEQAAFLDVTSIFAAEAFRLERRNSKVTQTLPLYLLLNVYFTNGGLQPKPGKEANHFSLLYSGLQTYIKTNGPRISEVLKRDHPWLYPLWVQEFAKGEENLISAFSAYVTNPDRGSRYKQWLVTTFIDALAQSGSATERFIETGDIQLNKEEEINQELEEKNREPEAEETGAINLKPKTP